MSRVRIAMIGRAGRLPAYTEDDVTMGVLLPWVEIDGHRFEDVIRATITAGTEVSGGVIIEFAASAEIVYVGSDREPLPRRLPVPEGARATLLNGERFDCDTVRPCEPTIDLLAE